MDRHTGIRKTLWRWLAIPLARVPKMRDIASESAAVSYDASKIDPALLARVLADPKNEYDVIVRSSADGLPGRADRAGKTIQQGGGRAKHALGIVGGASGSIKGTPLLALTNSKLVDYVFSDDPIRVSFDPIAGAAKATATQATAINATRVWSELGVTGRGIGVAVLDSGIAAHPDLGSRIVAAVDFTTPCAVTPCPAPAVSLVPLGDPGGHGTHVAGLIAGDGTSSGGATTGVAPNANVVDVRVISASGNSNTSTVLRGLSWVLANRSTYNIRVVNMSLGRAPTTSYKLDPLATAVEVLTFAGISVVVSAGNSGPLAGTITSPATDPYVISVGAVDDAGTAAGADDSIATFSSRGRTLFDDLVKPDLAAPGRKLVSLRSAGSTLDTLYPDRRVTATAAADAAYFRLSGTSMAAPVVAGTIALMLERNSTLSPSQIKKRLRSTAVAVPGATAFDQGAGMIDARAAVGSIDASKEYSSSRVSDAFAKDMRKFVQGQPISWKSLTFNGGVDSMNITWENITWLNITWENITWENITWENFTWANITWENITWENITWESSAQLGLGGLSGSGGSGGWAPVD